MVAKYFGYLIGGLFAIALILAPISVTSYFLFDSAYTILKLEPKEAVVTKCFTKRSSTGKPLTRNVPRAITTEGEIANGMIGELKYLSTCDEMVGDTLSVYIDPNNHKNNRINTFWQMWFLPLIFTTICLLWYPYLIKKIINKYKKKKSTL